jgi:hypothetical protein
VAEGNGLERAGKTEEERERLRERQRQMLLAKALSIFVRSCLNLCCGEFGRRSGYGDRERPLAKDQLTWSDWLMELIGGNLDLFLKHLTFLRFLTDNMNVFNDEIQVIY